MKKQYVNPTMEVVEMNTKCNILAGSLTSSGGSVNMYESAGDGGGALGRESDWDE